MDAEKSSRRRGARSSRRIRWSSSKSCACAILGRSSELKLALREVRDRETRHAPERLCASALETAFEERRPQLERGELERKLVAESVDVTLPGERFREGHLHLITQIRREVEDVFLGLGYMVVDGREVETTHYNFDGLNMPPWHPSRSRATRSS